MNRASFSTGDRVWRMPLWNYYSNHMKSKHFFFEKLVVTKFVYLFILFILESATADLNNISAVAGGGSCTAAAFLKVSFHFFPPKIYLAHRIQQPILIVNSKYFCQLGQVLQAFFLSGTI